MTGSNDTIPDIPSRAWTKDLMPQRILAIRLQAMGDLVITLPYLQQLKKMLPANSALHLLTRQEVEMIPKSIYLFDKVYSIAGGRDLKRQLLCTGMLLPQLLLQRYDVVIDLQNNIVSKMVRRALMPEAWSVFDRFSAISAGESTRLTIEAIGLGKCFADKTGFTFNSKDEPVNILKAHGWDGSSELVVLNPAGAFITRNWPIENYIGFAKLWLEKLPKTQFLVIGINTIAEKAFFLKSILGNQLIDLVNKTTPSQAFSVIQKASFVLSEDSGLMHMAWVSGIPTLAMFGSSKAIRSRPLGDHTVLLHSSDLSCGNCMLETCKYLDIHCLTRYTPKFVFERSVALIGHINAGRTRLQWL